MMLNTVAVIKAWVRRALDSVLDGCFQDSTHLLMDLSTFVRLEAEILHKDQRDEKRHAQYG
jgi:hypothetical protein